jgi:hypothetical protein
MSHILFLTNFTLKMEVIHSSEISVTTYKITWHHNPEDHDQHLYCHENLKSQTENVLFVETNVTCCRFAGIVAHHPYVILMAVAVLAGTCLIIPLTTKKLPDFSDPQMVSMPWLSSGTVSRIVLV